MLLFAPDWPDDPELCGTKWKSGRCRKKFKNDRLRKKAGRWNDSGDLGQVMDPNPKFRFGKVNPLPVPEPSPPDPKPVPRPFPRPPVIPDLEVPLIWGLGLETMDE